MTIIFRAGVISAVLMIAHLCLADTKPVFTLLGDDEALTLPDGIARTAAPPALSFSGTPLHLGAEAAAKWLPKKAITVEAWVRVNKAAQWTGIAGCLQDNGSYERGWVLGCHPTGFYFGIAANKLKRFTYLDAKMQLAERAWYHVVGTYDGKMQRIYLDGKLAGESQMQDGNIIYAETLLPVIGSYRDNNDNIPLNGELESLNVWAEALTSEQIAGRFNARKELFAGIEGVADKGSDCLDWPTYRHDNRRSGNYPQDLKLPLFTAWIHRPQHPPRPAWAGTAQSDFWRHRATPEKPIVEFDKAYHVVATGDRVLYGTSSDDKIVCLDLKSGKTRWQAFAEGPIRLAPTIVGKRVVFGSDDGFIYCLNLDDGTRIWRRSAVEEQGHRRPGNGRIIGQYPVRTGVIVRDEVVYFAAGLFPKQGVWHCALALADGRRLDSKPMKASPQGYLREQGGQLFAPTGRHPAGAFLRHLKRRGKVAAKEAAAISKDYPYAFVSTPSHRYAGGDGEIAILDASTGKMLGKVHVEGRVLGLAIAGETLLASTDSGATYAFTASRRDRPVTNHWPITAQTVSDTATKPAEMILARCGRQRGYALVVGDRGGNFTKELASRSEFQVIGIGLSQKEITSQRTVLAQANLYGRVVIHDVSVDQPPYLDHVFNLVVLSPELEADDDSTWIKLLRPGGLLFHGATIKTAPAIEGAGSWSHLYGDPGNTACSRDSLSTADLQLQWFGEPGPQHIIDRHLRAMSPVARDGFLYVPGNDYLYGVDAFNGVVLWEKQIKNFRRIGVLRGSGSLAVGEKFLFAAAGDRCLVLERGTGEVVRTISLPKDRNPREWGYLAVLGETVIGSATGYGGVYRTFARDAIYSAGYGDNTKITVSTELFATNGQTGKRIWTYQPKGAIFDPAIAVNDSYIVFLESRNERTLGGPSRTHYPDLLDAKGGSLVALDRKTGKVAWNRQFNSPKGVQTMFLSCTDDEIVVAFSRNTVANGASKPTVHYESRVYESDGKPRWQKSFDTGLRPNLDHGEQDRHPAIVGSRLIVEPNIYDLADGTLVDTFKRGYGCGTISASADDLFFRSGNPACYSLTTKVISSLNSVSRPGCWINVITSDGLVLVPEGSSGCICKFPIQASMVFAPRE